MRVWHFFAMGDWSGFESFHTAITVPSSPAIDAGFISSIFFRKAFYSRPIKPFLNSFHANGFSHFVGDFATVNFAHKHFKNRDVTIQDFHLQSISSHQYLGWRRALTESEPLNIVRMINKLVSLMRFNL